MCYAAASMPASIQSLISVMGASASHCKWPLVLLHESSSAHSAWASVRSPMLAAKTRRAILRYLRGREMTPCDSLFTSGTGRPLNPNSLLLIMKRLGRLAGIDHCSPHAFRRSFALWSYRQGMGITDLQLMLGHSDLTVLKRYLDVQTTDLEAAHRRFGPVDMVL